MKETKGTRGSGNKATSVQRVKRRGMVARPKDAPATSARSKTRSVSGSPSNLKVTTLYGPGHRRPPGRPAAAYAAVSLFSGCGGLDLGAEMTGAVRSVWAVDNDPWAVRTYAANLGGHIWLEDVRETEYPEVPCDILLAGPPCQDFSSLWNHDGAKTARGNLFREVARFLDQRQPAAFVLENVPGLLSANHGEAWLLVRHALRAPSQFLYDGVGPRYEVSAQVVDFADLGVPQRRPRLIILGIRRDLGIRPPPIPRPFADKPKTVREALDDDPIREGAPNHEIGADSKDVVERLKLIPPGMNYTTIPKDHPLFVKGLISHVYRRLDPDKPAYTVIAGGGGGTHGYHHVEPRRLSNRERARLQSFPDDFIFDGGPGRSNYTRVRRQVGNAVPPVAAKEIVGALVAALRSAKVPGTAGRMIMDARRAVSRTDDELIA
jgi:DNA (cytosine-5)-methyltransferase 1